MKEFRFKTEKLIKVWSSESFSIYAEDEESAVGMVLSSMDEMSGEIPDIDFNSIVDLTPDENKGKMTVLITNDETGEEIFKNGKDY